MVTCSSFSVLQNLSVPMFCINITGDFEPKFSLIKIFRLASSSVRTGYHFSHCPNFEVETSRFTVYSVAANFVFLLYCIS